MSFIPGKPNYPSKMNPASNEEMADALDELALAARVVANKLMKFPAPSPSHAIELVGAVAMLRGWARELRRLPTPIKNEKANR